MMSTHICSVFVYLFLANYGNRTLGLSSEVVSLFLSSYSFFMS